MMYPEAVFWQYHFHVLHPVKPHSSELSHFLMNSISLESSDLD